MYVVKYDNRAWWYEDWNDLQIGLYEIDVSLCDVDIFDAKKIDIMLTLEEIEND